MKKYHVPGKEWDYVTPEKAGLSSEKLSSLDLCIEKNYKNLTGVAIVRNGSIVHETYFKGYSKDDAKHVASVTKSVISALIGIAIEQGYIKDVDQSVLSFFPEYKSNPNDVKKKAITIRHLLTMSAPYAFLGGRDPFGRLCRQTDWTTFILNQLGQHGEIGDFKYSSIGVHLLSMILTKTTGMSAREYANKNLFQQIGMQLIPEYEMKGFGQDDLFGHKLKGWVHDPKGNSTGGWGLALNLRDMARFGLLYLNKGVWNKTQVISKDWIEESITKNKNEYGYLWWLAEIKGMFVYFAAGSGGNIILCLPEKDIVVAITSEITSKPKDRLKLIEEYILPSIML